MVASATMATPASSSHEVVLAWSRLGQKARAKTATARTRKPAWAWNAPASRYVQPRLSDAMHSQKTGVGIVVRRSPVTRLGVLPMCTSRSAIITAATRSWATARPVTSRSRGVIVASEIDRWRRLSRSVPVPCVTLAHASDAHWIPSAP